MVDNPNSLIVEYADVTKNAIEGGALIILTLLAFARYCVRDYYELCDLLWERKRKKEAEKAWKERS